MVTVAVSELTGAALDWAVAKAVGFSDIGCSGNTMRRWAGAAKETLETVRFYDENSENLTVTLFSPSTDWAQLGPLVDQFDVAMIPSNHAEPHEKWSASVGAYSHYIDESLPLNIRDGGMTGPTPLIAACRAIVFVKIGKTVDIPQELAQCPQ